MYRIHIDPRLKESCRYLVSVFSVFSPDFAWFSFSSCWLGVLWFGQVTFQALTIWPLRMKRSERQNIAEISVFRFHWNRF